MKKILFLSAVALATSFASCKKAKTCTCTQVAGSTTFTNIKTFDKVSKSTANTLCPKTTVYTDASSGQSTSVTCVLS